MSRPAPTMGETSSGQLEQSYPAALLLAGLAYALTHHVGSLPDGLGRWGVTRPADWIDLATPYLVLPPVLVAIAASSPGRRALAATVIGTIGYAQGHGIHLAANSVYNDAPGPAAHLWDELIGHLVWYAGAAVLIAVLASTMPGRARPSGAHGLVAAAVALGVGVTWATNALGGGTGWFALPFALACTAFGWRHRDGLGALLVVAFAPACLLIPLL